MAKIIAILKHFDVDLYGCRLCHELANLWMASLGQTLRKEQYEEACYMANTDPEAGIDAKALAALYEDGMVDLEKDFGGLQEELEMKAYDESKNSGHRHPSWGPCNDERRAYHKQDRPSKKKGGTTRTRWR